MPGLCLPLLSSIVIGLPPCVSRVGLACGIPTAPVRGKINQTAAHIRVFFKLTLIPLIKQMLDSIDVFINVIGVVDHHQVVAEIESALQVLFMERCLR